MIMNWPNKFHTFFQSVKHQINNSLNFSSRHQPVADPKPAWNKEFFKQWLYLLAVIISGLLVALFFLFNFIINANTLDWRSAIEHQITPQSARLIDGVVVNRERAKLKPIAIMLENHVDSRPIAGLEQASIIYETIVEGDITRFLAIFDGNLASKKIGPIRSARPFFVELAQEWNPVYWHAGGSSEALTMLKQSSMYNVNEISGDGIYFWRDTRRPPPHNLFTSADQIKRALAAKEIATTADFTPWPFKNDEAIPLAEAAVEDITINFSADSWYQVVYRYNPDNNDYTRYQDDKIHKTEAGIILKAKNIIVQHVTYDIIDDYGRLEINLTGRGAAEVYRDGSKIEGYWKKTNGRTYFYNSKNNSLINLNRGTTWVELVFD